MALNLSTFATACDTVSDLIDNENDTAAHFSDAATDVRSDQAACTEAIRLYTNLGSLLNKAGLAQLAQTPETPTSFTS